MVRCPVGTWGSTTGLTTAACSGQCTTGTGCEMANDYLLMRLLYPLYFTTFRSGNYCPIGSAAMVPCPAGTWGSTTSLTTAACSGQCSAGMG